LRNTFVDWNEPYYLINKTIIELFSK